MKFSLKKCIFFFILFALCLVFVSPNDYFKQAIRKSTPDYNRNVLLNEYINTLSLEQKISQMLLVSAEGNVDFVQINDFKAGIKDGIVPGGYLLFGYNIADTKEKVKEFIKSIHATYNSLSLIQPYISIDHEGGVVNRLKKFSKQPLLPPLDVSSNYACNQAFNLYSTEAAMLFDLGIHFNFAPVVEFQTDYNKDFLQKRTFGSLENAISYSKVQIKAFDEQGVFSVIKHFPGNSSQDPHLGTSVLDIPYLEFENLLIPFEQALTLKPSGVLISHGIVPVIDDVPACFSKKMVTDVLRKKMKYDRIIFSDDMYMKALSNENSSLSQSAIKAIKAGINVIMMSDKSYISIVKEISKVAKNDTELQEQINKSVKYILSEKLFLGLLPELSEKLTRKCSFE